nr:retrovirus-related Pol polyprotein from transposon TNT 1-94 [Tanacetum cinerariifolium]
MEILIQTCLMPLAIKAQNDSFKFVHELKQEMHADLKYVESLEKEIDKLESDKAESSNMYDKILQDCVSKDVMCSYLQSLSDLDALAELQCFKCLWKKREQYLEIQDLEAKLEDKNIAISELKKLIEKSKGKSVDTKFDRPSVVRQSNAQRIPKPSVLEGLSKPVTIQTLPKTTRKATLNAFFKEEGIKHQTSTARTPEQNGVVERRNRTLVEAARTMLSASRLPLFFWAKAITTACYTQNRSIIIPTHGKTPYHIINDRKPSIKHLHIFCCICYITRDGENLDKMKEKEVQCILVGYSTQSKGYHVYNKRTRMIVESIHTRFDEIKEVYEMSVANNTSGLVPQRQKASDYENSDLIPQRQDVSSLADADVPSQQELDLLFGPLYDEFFNASSNPSTNIPFTSAPSTHTNMHAEENNNDQAKEGEQLQDDEFTNPFYHPLEQVRRNPSRLVQRRRQLATYPEMCMYALTVSTTEPKNIKEAMADSAWIEAMLEELHQFNRLQHTAFLNGPLKEEVYVAQPDGFVDPDHPEK